MGVDNEVEVEEHDLEKEGIVTVSGDLVEVFSVNQEKNMKFKERVNFIYEIEVEKLVEGPFKRSDHLEIFHENEELNMIYNNYLIRKGTNISYIKNCQKIFVRIVKKVLFGVKKSFVYNQKSLV